MNTIKKEKRSKSKIVDKVLALILVVSLTFCSMPINVMEVSAETTDTNTLPTSSVVFPTDLTTDYDENNTLGDIGSIDCIVDNEVVGTFDWVDETIVPTVVNSGYEITFTPSTGYEDKFDTVTKTVDLEVNPKNFCTNVIRYSVEYTGEAQTPDVPIILDENYVPYSNQSDFTIKYGWEWNEYTLDKMPTFTNAIPLGKYLYYEITRENYSTHKGSISVVIKPLTISTVNEDFEFVFEDEQTYTGNEVTPSVTIKFKGETLVENTDYKLEYKNNIDVCTTSSENSPTILITGMGNFTGTASCEFTINLGLTISKIPNQVYTGSKIEPELTISYHGKELVKGTDYTVEYKGNKNIGTAKAIVTFIGNYEGTKEKTVTFKITKPLNEITNLAVEDWTYGDEPNTPSADLIDGNLEDITYSYSTEKGGTYTNEVPTESGTYWLKASIAEIENYQGATAKTKFIIKQKELTATVAKNKYGHIPEKTYDGTTLFENLELELVGVLEKDIANVTATATGNTESKDASSGTSGSEFIASTVDLKDTTGNYKLLPTDITGNVYIMPVLVFYELEIDKTECFVGDDVKLTVSQSTKNFDTGKYVAGTVKFYDRDKYSASKLIGEARIDTKTGITSFTFEKPSLGEHFIISEFCSEDKNHIAYMISVLGSLNVVNKINKITNLSINDWTYGDEPSTPSANVKFGDAKDIKYTYSTEENGTYTSEVPTEAGDYWLKAKALKTKEYKAVTAKTKFVIEQKKLTATIKKDEYGHIPEKTYDGTTLFENLELDLIGVLEKDKENITATATGNTASADKCPNSLGSEFTASSVDLKDKTGNYSLLPTDVSGNVCIFAFIMTLNLEIDKTECFIGDDVVITVSELIKDPATGEYIDGTVTISDAVNTSSKPEFIGEPRFDTETGRASFTLKKPNLGEHYIYVKFNSENTNYISNNMYILKKFEVLEKVNEITNLAIADWTYGDDPITPSANVKFGDAKDIVYTYSTEENGSYTSDVSTQAGDYWLKAEALKTNEYEAVTAKTQFQISPKNINQIIDFRIEDIDIQTYTGSSVEPDIKVMIGDKKLVKDTDYTVSCEDNIEVSDYIATVKVTGIGNYTGYKTEYFSITNADITDNTVKKQDKEYNGKVQSPSAVDVTVLGDNKVYIRYYNTETKDYDLKKIPSFTDVGTYTIKYEAYAENHNTVTGKIKFSITKTYNGYGCSFPDKFIYGTYAENQDWFVPAYGEADKWEYGVLSSAADMDDEDLYMNVKFTYDLPKDAGYYVVKQTVPDTANYYEVINYSTFKIKTKDINDITIQELQDKYYTGSKIAQDIVATYNGETLVKDVDYTLHYDNATNVSTDTKVAVVTVKGIGNYTGKLEKTFKILKAPNEITDLAIENWTYGELPNVPTAESNFGKVIFGYSVNESGSYSQTAPTEVGTYWLRARVVETNNYEKAMVKTQFEIVTKSIDSDDISIGKIDNSDYTGEAIKPQLIIKDCEKTLVEGTDYTVSYSDNTSIGTATITIKGIGNYSGETTTTFDILKLIQTIKIDEIKDKTFGAESFDLSVSGIKDSGTLTYSVPEDNGVVTIENGKVTIIGAGTVVITATTSGDDIYESTTSKYTLTVAKKPVTVVIDDKEIIRGMDIPVFTGTSSDSVIVPQYSVTADEMTAGEYEIVMTNADDYSNYDIKVTTGKLTIKTGYTVTVDGVETNDVAYGTVLTKPTDPTKTGYTFKGWYVGEDEFDFDTEITEDIEITAKWKKIVDKEFEVTGNTEVTVSKESEDQLKDELFTKEEVAQNEEMKVSVKVDVVAIENMDKTAQVQFDKYLADYNAKLEDDLKSIQAMIFDISVIKSLAGVQTNITNLKTPISITIKIPQEFQSEEREFFILRNHQGTVEFLNDLDQDSTTITFETDCFSNYTLNYTEKTNEVAPETSPESDIDTPQTGDNSNVLLIFISLLVSALGIIVATKKDWLNKIK